MKDINFEKDYYLILGVEEDVSEEDLKKRYRVLAKKTHPDLNKSANAVEDFKAVQEAYAVLGETSTRSQYDAYRSQTKHHFGTNIVHFDRKARKAAQESGKIQARNLSIFESATRPRTLLFLGIPLLFAAFFASDAETNKQRYSNARPGGAKSIDQGSDYISLYKNPRTGKWERPDPAKAHTGVYNSWETKSVPR